MLICENPADEAVTHQAIANLNASEAIVPPTAAAPRRRWSSIAPWAVAATLLLGVFGYRAVPTVPGGQQLITLRNAFTGDGSLAPRVVCAVGSPSYRVEQTIVSQMRCQLQYPC